MPRISLTQYESVADAIDDGSFVFTVPSIPYVGGAQDLTFSCQTVAIPGVRTNPIEFKLCGHTRYFRGAQQNGDSRLQITASENVNMSIYNKLITWHAAGVDPNTGNSSSGFQTNAVLDIIDTTGATAAEFVFYNMFVEDIPAITLDGSNSKNMTISATLIFDWFECSSYNSNLDLGASAASFLAAALSSLGGTID